MPVAFRQGSRQRADGQRALAITDAEQARRQAHRFRRARRASCRLRRKSRWRSPRRSWTAQGPRPPVHPCATRWTGSSAGPFAAFVLDEFDRHVDDHLPAGIEQPMACGVRSALLNCPLGLTEYFCGREDGHAMATRRNGEPGADADQPQDERHGQTVGHHGAADGACGRRCRVRNQQAHHRLDRPHQRQTAGNHVGRRVAQRDRPAGRILCKEPQRQAASRQIMRRRCRWTATPTSRLP